jgi:predicted peptidase
MRFFYKVILLITAILCCKPSFAQQFEPKEFAGVKYQEFAKLSNKKKPALLIYLHGKSGSGEDNERQMRVPSVWDIEKYLRESKMPIYFIVPQCPPTHEWIAHRDLPGYEDKIFELIDHYIKEVGVDPNRIYICGVSMGAMGTWKILRERNDFFAAAFIASGGNRNAEPNEYLKTPLCVTVGEFERSTEDLRWLSSEIERLGGKIDFSVLPGLGHREACDEAFTAERLKWLFSHSMK